jgi:Mn2+/Fe2+ NRAMP family transporter
MPDALDKRSSSDVKQPERPKLLEIMGPGLITGASDDDPSGIATCSQAGAQFGVNVGWTLMPCAAVTKQATGASAHLFSVTEMRWANSRYLLRW